MTTKVTSTRSLAPGSQKYVAKTTTVTKTKKSFKKKKGKGKLSKGPFRLYNQADPVRPTMSCKFIYSDTYTLTTGAAGVYGAEQIMRLNSLYDPDLSGGGHQPLYFDQMTALYRHYMVNGCKIELTYDDPSTDGLCVAAVVEPSSEIATVTSAAVGVPDEQPMTVVRYLNNTGSQRVYLKQYLTIAQIEGKTKTQIQGDQSEYSAAYNASPSKTPLMRIAVASVRGAAGATVIVRVRITYYTKLSERLIQSQS